MFIHIHRKFQSMDDIRHGRNSVFDDTKGKNGMWVWVCDSKSENLCKSFKLNIPLE